MSVSTVRRPAVESNGKPRPRSSLSAICLELQRLQRQRAVIIKSRNMQANRLQAIVAGSLGYTSTMKEADRKKKFTEATKKIKAICDGEEDDATLGPIIRATMIGITSFNQAKDDIETVMEKEVLKLPVMEWLCHKDRRGFGSKDNPLFLAIIIGETGDLSKYANPAKVWRRMGCAPFEHGGKTLMGATWRTGKYGKLPSEKWEEFGYSPRRRSIAYQIGENIVRGNAEGPYRKCYDVAKKAIKGKHPDYTDLRCHRHGMLLATKSLLLDLWCAWHGKKRT